MDQGTPALNKALLVPLIIVIAMVPGLLALSGIAHQLTSFTNRLYCISKR